jgi:hypothetical protein
MCGVSTIHTDEIKMKKIYIFILIVLIGNKLYSQLQDRIWIFGRPITGSTNATLYFGNLSNPVVNLPNGQPNNITVNNGAEQWAVVTNPFNGKLIFYTDGKNVFDSLNNMVSSLDLGGNPSCSQPVAIAPVPRSDTKASYKVFYIFSNETGATATSADTGTITYRFYNAVSQTFGTSHNLPGIYGTATVTEGMKIIPCDNNGDILWLIVSLYPSPGYERKYVVYKIDKNIVTYQGDYDLGAIKMPLAGSFASPIIDITYTKANTNFGISNVAFALQYSSAVFTCQFDNINGQFLTNTAKTCSTGYASSMPTVYNVEFSPNGKLLYYTVYAFNGSSNELFQIDLQDPVYTPTLIHSFPYEYGTGLKLGPDSLIYNIYDNGTYSNQIKLGRILQPNIKYIPGTTNYSQFYQENFQTYTNVYGGGLCEFLVLPTVASGIFETQNSNTAGLSMYPNPASDVVTMSIENRTNTIFTVNIYNAIGKLVRSEFLTQDQQQINIDDLCNGVYTVSVSSKDLIENQRLIIKR